MAHMSMTGTIYDCVSVSDFGLVNTLMTRVHV